MNKKNITTIAAIAGFSTLSIHLINRLCFNIATKHEILSNNKNQYYEWRFGKIRYTKKGKGSPIILIHDLSVGSSSYEFNEIIDKLSETKEVYSIDLLGYGLSDKPHITYTNYLYVQSVIDFIKNVVGKKADIIATGASSTIAIMAAHNDEEAINKIFLINPQNPSRFNQVLSKKKTLLKCLIDFPIIGTFLYNIFTSQKAIKKTFENEYFFDTSMISETDIKAYAESAHIHHANARFSYSSYISKYTDTNIIHALKQINHSIYIINGAEKENSKDISQIYQNYNLSVEAFFIENTKHLPHMENPSEVISVISLIC